MSDFITKLSDMIDPEVMGDMVSARIPKKLRVAPFAKIDDTLAGGGRGAPPGHPRSSFCCSAGHFAARSPQV